MQVNQGSPESLICPRVAKIQNQFQNPKSVSKSVWEIRLPDTKYIREFNDLSIYDV